MIVPPPLRALPSSHRDAIEAAFGPTLPPPLWQAPAVPLVLLCFTNRCGSNYVAQLLAGTGAVNEAGEYFNAATVLEHAGALHLRNLAAYVAALPGLIPWAGPMAAKAAPDQLALLADAGVLAAWSPRPIFLFLERADRLGQAISRVIAGRTGRYTLAHAAIMPAAAVPYDRAAIAAELAAIERANALFAHFFRANGIVPLHTTYEAVMADPAPLLAAVGDALGRPGLAADPAAITLRRQRDETNAAWRAAWQAGR